MLLASLARFPKAAIFLTLTASTAAQAWPFGRRQPEVRRAEPVPPRAIPVEDAPVPRAIPVMPSWQETMQSVDRIKNSDQLFRPRVQDTRFVDACSAQFGSQKSFGDAIRLGIEQSLQRRVYPFNSVVREVHYLPDNALQRATSLTSQPFCAVTKESLDHMLGADKNGVPHTPQPHVIAKMASYVNLLENARRRSNAGDREATADFVKMFSVLMGCLAYGESLTTPGDPSDPVKKQTFDDRFNEYISSSEALKTAFGVAPDRPAPERPAGVIFSRDRNGMYFTLLNKIAINAPLTDADRESMAQALEVAKQPALIEKLKTSANLKHWEAAEKDTLKKAIGGQYEEWLSVGLYQFMPSSTGNIAPCVDAWNETFRWGGCQIKKTEAHTARALLSSGQGFNAFCGAQKLVHSFATQTNTSSPEGTDIANQKDGQLLPPAYRCVTIYGRGGRGRTYAHFGPLRNSVMNRKTPEGERIPDNMEALFDCVDSALPKDFRLGYSR